MLETNEGRHVSRRKAVTERVAIEESRLLSAWPFVLKLGMAHRGRGSPSESFNPLRSRFSCANKKSNSEISCALCGESSRICDVALRRRLEGDAAGTGVGPPAVGVGMYPELTTDGEKGSICALDDVMAVIGSGIAFFVGDAWLDVAGMTFARRARRRMRRSERAYRPAGTGGQKSSGDKLTLRQNMR